MKKFIVLNKTMLHPTSIRDILVLASVMKFKLFMHDVTQTYFQFRKMLTREVYFRPKTSDKHIFDVDKDEILKRGKFLYGLCNSGDYWICTIKSHLTNYLGREKQKSDPSLCLNSATRLAEISRNYVHCIIIAGDPSFNDEYTLTLKIFKSKIRV